MDILLELRDLRTYFFMDAGVVKAVDGISYVINEGETMALVGESACGKSVSALSIMQLVPKPNGRIVGGQVLFLGQSLLELSNEEMSGIRGNRIGMVFQEPMTSLNPVLTVGAQLMEPLQIHLKLDRRQSHRRAVELLQMVGMADPERRLKAYPHQLSGGMRQRVMIAMALSCRPKLIIADEPTTALDVTIEAQVLDLMKRLCTDLGTALILITHNLGVVARYADSVRVMYAGKLVEEGRAEDVYRNPCHPYTQGLLRSVPRLDAPPEEELVPIEGRPPDLLNLPPGCSFLPRCSYAFDRCARDVPPLEPVGDAHATACWIADQFYRSPTGSRG